MQPLSRLASYSAGTAVVVAPVVSLISMPKRSLYAVGSAAHTALCCSSSVPVTGPYP